jgi:tetratricopeptide (TPR) repeat protein
MTSVLFMRAIAWIAFFSVISCASVIPRQEPPTPAPPPETRTLQPPGDPAGPREAPEGPPREERPATPKQPGPRLVASLQLTEQARMLIEQNEIDQALRVLERAVNINPSNGQSYYYLAECWILKGKHAQASEFNRLAERFLGKDSEWMKRVRKQKEYLELF